jgi:hypothetical protein
MYNKFTEKLRKLCNKHNVLLSGKIRILDKERFIDGQNIEFTETIVDGITTDRTGPFIILTAQEKPHEGVGEASKAPMIFDKDMLLKDGVMCPADGKRYTTRKEWNDTLKARGFIEVGDQAKAERSKEVRGDFNVAKELKDAVQQHLR